MLIHALFAYLQNLSLIFLFADESQMSEEILGKVEAVGENQEGSFSAIFGKEQTLKIFEEEHASKIFEEEHASKIFGEEHTLKISREKQASKIFGEEQTSNMEISHQQVAFRVLFLFVLLNEFCDCRVASNIIRMSQIILTSCPKYSQYSHIAPIFFTIHALLPQNSQYLPCFLKYSQYIVYKVYIS